MRARTLFQVVGALTVSACRPAAAPVPGECASCHPAQVEAVKRSHHARGQAIAGALPEGTVGAFSITDGGAVLAWRGADGGVERFPVRYTIGVEPLVQVAAELPGGALQVPPLALIDGGWQALPSELDWRSPSFNWNGSCAPCHATGFVVGPPSRWANLAVTCEACHGDAGGHRAWLTAGKPRQQHAGFAFTLAGRTTFAFEDGGSIARPGVAREDVQSEVCAACHARRRPLRDDGALAGRLFERFEPSLVEEGLWSPTGQVVDEVFEVQSFLLSKMHGAGVRCSDCHEPHSAKPRAEGNALCAQCHRPPSTHPAGACVSCHMPSKVFMTAHVRHDHFIVSPSPPGERVGVRANRARSSSDSGEPAGRGIPRATESSSSLLRASSLGDAAAIATAAQSDDPWLRFGAATALLSLPPRERLAPGARLIGDPLRAIRVRAARALVGVTPVSTAVLAELEEAERANTFRGDGWLNLGTTALALGKSADAEARWRRGLEIDPSFAPLTINLADLLRATGRDAEGRALLEAAVKQPGPWEAPLAYALGLSRWRAGDKAGALASLAAASRDGNVVHLRAWCLAVRELEGADAGARALAAALALHPGDPSLLALTPK